MSLDSELWEYVNHSFGELAIVVCDLTLRVRTVGDVTRSIPC